MRGFAAAGGGESERVRAGGPLTLFPPDGDDAGGALATEAGLEVCASREGVVGREVGAELAGAGGTRLCNSSRIARSTVVTRCSPRAGTSAVSSALGDCVVGGDAVYGVLTGGDAPPLWELRLAFEEVRRFFGVNVRISSSSSASESADVP